MKTIGEQLNLFYKKNQKLLDSNHLKPGKVIFRPISKHVHAWFEQFKDKNDFSKENLINILIKYPKLIERPIVEDDKYAVIARPIDNLKEFFNK